MSETKKIKEAKRIVIKIGSALLAEEAGGIRKKWLRGLISDLVELKNDGSDIVLVSSGAIALGRKQLGLPLGPIKLEEKQAAAATGQIRLAHAYQELLAEHDVNVAQILLTLEDTENRRRHLNARNTLDALLKMKVVPVINENDTIATEEIRFGDNDRLAARVAAMIGADLLILLSDIDGLYTADPKFDPEARHVPNIDTIDQTIMKMAGKAPPGFSSGGMITKLEAARIATGAGCATIIANGKDMHALTSIHSDDRRYTYFSPTISSRDARKKWIAASVKPKGKLIIDDGAVKALRSGRSLLPAGVQKIDGRFFRGDPVLILDQAGKEIGLGLSAYDASDTLKILGKKSHDVVTILGHRGRDEIIHRDDFVLYSG